MTIKFYEHPQYINSVQDWIVYKDLFTGDHDTMTRAEYLWPHEFESMRKGSGGNKLRQSREKRSSYVNLVKPFIDRYIALIFRNQPVFECVEKLIPKDELNNIDGEGNDLVTFIKRAVAMPYFLYGSVYVMSDSYNFTATSANEEQQAGIRPYCEPLDTMSVVDWQIEEEDPARRGKLNFLRCEYDLLAPRMSASEEPKMVRYSKVMSVVEGRYVISLFESEGDEWKAVDEIVTELSEIPVAWNHGESWIKHTVPMALTRHNLMSSLDNQLHYQAHQRVIAAANIKGEESTIVLNESNLAVLPEGSSIQVVEPTNPVALRERLDQVTIDMFKVAFMQTNMLPADSRAVQSFETIREGKEDFYQAAISAAKDIEQIVEQMLRGYLSFKGQEDADIEFKLDKDITIESVDEQIKLMQASLDRINRYPTWRKEVDKKLAGQMNLTNADDIQQEIEEQPAIGAAVTRQGLLNQLTDGNARRATESS